MYQSNFGLAEQDVQIARNVLATVQRDAPEELAEDLETVLLHLDLALSNLPSFPVAASDDLDIGWQILLTGSAPTPTAAAGTPTCRRVHFPLLKHNRYSGPRRQGQSSQL